MGKRDLSTLPDVGSVALGTPVSATAPSREDRRPRTKALLAGGVVLGVGAAIVLAAWNSSEFANSNFVAGAFTLQGSSLGPEEEHYTENHTSPGAALRFQLNPTNLAPGDTVYAPFSVRLSAATTRPATVLIGNTSTGNVQGLTYGLVSTPTFECNATSFAAGSPLIPSGTPLGVAPASAAFPLSVGQANAAGQPKHLCIAVTAGPGLVERQAGAAVWKFDATSQ